MYSFIYFFFVILQITNVHTNHINGFSKPLKLEICQNYSVIKYIKKMFPLFGLEVLDHVCDHIALLQSNIAYETLIKKYIPLRLPRKTIKMAIELDNGKLGHFLYWMCELASSLSNLSKFSLSADKIIEVKDSPISTVTAWNLTQISTSAFQVQVSSHTLQVHELSKNAIGLNQRFHWQSYAHFKSNSHHLHSILIINQAFPRL